MRKSILLFLFFAGICFSLPAQTPVINGNAYSTGSNCYVITNAAVSQRGSVWFRPQLNLNTPFDIRFTMNFGMNDAGGGDGMTFVLQRAGTGALGSTGGSLSYSGISPSIAVEFDTYQNATLTDPVFDHLALISNGVLDHLAATNIAGPVSATPSQANIEDNLDHRIRITWNPADDSLLVYFDCELRIAVQYNIIANIFGGNSMVWWGFTGSGGGAFNRQSACLLPTPPVFIRDTTVCRGDSVQLNAPQGSNYVWSPAIGINNTTGANPIFFPLTTTKYYVNYLDECNRPSIDSILINVSSVNLNLGADTNICYGHSILLTADPGYSGYIWQNGSSGQTFTASSTGIYWVAAINSRGCYGIDSIRVNIRPQLSLNVTPGSPAICFGDSISLTASGALNYNWSPSIGLSNLSGVSINASPPATTNYHLVASDSWGCVDSMNFSVVVHQLPIVTVSSDTSVCLGSSTQLSASGGISYSWNPAASLNNSSASNPFATPSITTLYTVHATDANGCTGIGNVNVVVNPLPVIVISPDTAVCIGRAVTLSASGGIAYSWTPGTGLSNPGISNPVASPTVRTTYSVTVTDVLGCSSSANTTVNVNPLPVVGIIPDTALCLGSGIQLFASGGINYSWSPSSSLDNPNIANPVATPVANTVYHVTVVDANGCVNDATTSVVVHPYVVVSVIADQSICIGSNTQLNSSGGISYSWTPVSGLNDPLIANPIADPLTTTTYTVSVTDVFGCMGSGTVMVTVNPLPVVSVNQNTTVCLGQSAQLSASGGIIYSWNPANSLTNSGISNPLATPVTTTTYTVYVTDTLGCSSSANTTVIVNPLPVVTITPDSTICIGSTIQLHASGGINFSWSPSSYLDNFNIPDPSANPQSTTTYTVVVTDSNGCVNNASVQVIVNPYISASVGSDQSICIGSSAQLFASGGTIYSWSPTTGLDDPNAANPVASPDFSMSYTVTVSDINRCSSEGTVTVTVNPLPVVNATEDTSIVLGTSISLFAEGGINYEWVPDSYLDCSNCDRPLATPMQDMIYLVVVTDVNGCKNQDTVSVTVEDVTTLYVPGAFTPGNHDGKNDILFAYGIGIKEFSLEIFDRWGKIIFESDDLAKGWDGTFQGQPVQDGIYIYSAKVVSYSGKTKTLQGSIHLIY